MDILDQPMDICREQAAANEVRLAMRGDKKSWRRPTLARASPALPSAMEPLTSVFGMGTGMTTPLWPPAKNRQLGTKENYDSQRDARDDLTL